MVKDHDTNGTDATAFDDCLAALVKFIVAEPGMAERILETHVPNHYDECRACSGQLRRTKWPCVHCTCAQKAQALLTAGFVGSGQ
jgi:hypothetical protein